MEKLKSLLSLNRGFMYRFFILFPQWKSFRTQNLKDFSNIIREFHIEYVKAVAAERYGVELPLKLGKHVVVSYKSKRPYPRFKGGFNAVENKSPGVYTNNDTDGLKCKLIFTNSDFKYRVKDRYIWSFEPSVLFKKRVSEAFKSDYKKYIYSPDNQPIKTRGWELKTKEITDAKIAKFLLTYDEFKMN